MGVLPRRNPSKSKGIEYGPAEARSPACLQQAQNTSLGLWRAGVLFMSAGIAFLVFSLEAGVTGEHFCRHAGMQKNTKSPKCWRPSAQTAVCAVIARPTGRACSSLLASESIIPHVASWESSKFRIPWMVSADAYHVHTIERQKSASRPITSQGLSVIHTHFKLSEAKTELVSPSNL